MNGANLPGRPIIEEVMIGLSERIGARFSGSPGEHQAAEFISKMFSSLGVETLNQRFDFIGWAPVGEPSLEFVEPEWRVCRAAPMAYSGSTPAGGVEGELQWHGHRKLIAGLYEMPTYSVLDRARQPLCQLIVNPDGSAIPLINPYTIYRMPLLVIGADDHAYVQRLLRDERTIRVRASVQTTLDPGAHSYNVIGRYTGSPGNDRRGVVCAHYDTQLATPGCYDNASGVAGLFGILEILQAARSPINVDFIAVAGEEVGMHGSEYYVRDLEERGLLEKVSWCVCLDQISGGETFWLWCSDPQLRRAAEAAIAEVGVEELGPIRIDPNKPGADHWAFHVRGVPACLLMWWRQPDYHRPTDTYERADMHRVRRAVDVGANLVRRLGEGDPDHQAGTV